MCDAIDTEGGDVTEGSDVVERGSEAKGAEEGGMDTAGAAGGNDDEAGEAPMSNPRADIPVVTASSVGVEVAPVPQGDSVEDPDDAAANEREGGGIGDAAPQLYMFIVGGAGEEDPQIFDGEV